MVSGGMRVHVGSVNDTPAFEEPDAKMYRESPSPIPSSSNLLPGSVSAIPAAVLLLVHKEIVLLGCPLLVLNDAEA